MASCCHKINGRIPCPAKVEHTIGGRNYCRHHVPYNEQKHASSPIEVERVECPDHIRKWATKFIRDRAFLQCQGTAKSTNAQCRQNAGVGSLLCNLHGGPNILKRYIHHEEVPAAIEDMIRAVMSIVGGVEK